MAPSTAAPQPVWLVAGQSNALLMEPFLASYATIRNAADSGRPITDWDAPPAGRLWPDVLRGMEPTKPDALLWWQGEGEAGSLDDALKVPGYYFGKFDSVIARARAAAGNPSLRVVVMELNIQFDTSNAQQEMRQWVAQDAHAVFIPTHDLEFRSDGLHMTDAGYTAVASRIRDALR